MILENQNPFKTNTVMGKTTVQAAVESNVRQVAAILRGELVKQARKDAAER